MKKIDKDSQEFIKWMMKRLEDPLWIEMMAVKNVYRMIRYWKSSGFKKILKQKLIDGAYEHGSPNKYTHKQAVSEVTKEYTDIIGWSGVDEWNELLRKQGRWNNERKTAK